MPPAPDCGCGSPAAPPGPLCARRPCDPPSPPPWRQLRPPAPPSALHPWPCGLCLRVRTPPLILSCMRRNLLLAVLLALLLLPTTLAEIHVVNLDIKDTTYSPTNDTVLYIKKEDQITFKCHPRDPRYRMFWSYSRSDFRDCVLKNALFDCSVTKDFQLQVTEYQWLPSLPSFLPEKPVYFLVEPVRYCKHSGMRVVAVISTKPTAPTTANRPRPPPSIPLQTLEPTKWKTSKEPQTLMNRQQMEEPSTTSAAKNSVSVSKAGRTFSSSGAITPSSFLILLSLWLSWR